MTMQDHWYEPPEDHCTHCGKPQPIGGWYATFGIGLEPEAFCTKECFEAHTEAEEDIAEEARWNSLI